LLINLDAKQLEFVCAAYLSKDKVAYEEILKGLDIHSANQQRFGLPERVIAKVFLFRLIYGGSAFSYAHDPEFTHVSSSEKFWQGVIDEAYNKYEGLAAWHNSIVQEVSRTGGLIVPPTHREYIFFRENGELPRPKILNYPVQGLGHDLMAILRVMLMRRLTRAKVSSKLVSTVHDSVLFDCPQDSVSTVCRLIFQASQDLPEQFERLFQKKFDLPFRVEVKVGPNWGDMTEVKETD